MRKNFTPIILKMEMEILRLESSRLEIRRLAGYMILLVIDWHGQWIVVAHLVGTQQLHASWRTDIMLTHRYY